MNQADALVAKFISFVVNPIILLLFSLGLLFFIYGLVQFMFNLAQGGENRSEGKSHMLWGIIGMFIMSSVFGIIRLLDSTFLLDIKNPNPIHLDIPGTMN